MPLVPAVDLGVDSVLDVVRHVYHLDGDERGDEFDILCPNPDHDDHSPSCSVNLVTGYFNCFSCRVGGDLAKLGSLVLQRDREEVERLLAPSTPEALFQAVQRRVKAIAMPTVIRRQRGPALPGPYEPGPLDELIDRGFTEETIEKWGVRFALQQTLQSKKGTDFTIRNSIAIPVRDSQGRLMAWVYRRTEGSPDWQPRYIIPNNIEISEVWFGLQHHANAEHIAIGEGALDAMWIDQCGFPALGLLGTQMGHRKIQWLNRYKSVTLFCDRDAGGAEAVQRIGGIIGRTVPLYVAQYDRKIKPGEKCDPQDLAPIDVEIAMARRVSWTKFLMRLAG